MIVHLTPWLITGIVAVALIVGYTAMALADWLAGARSPHLHPVGGDAIRTKAGTLYLVSRATYISFNHSDPCAIIRAVGSNGHVEMTLDAWQHLVEGGEIVDVGKDPHPYQP